MNAVLGSGDDQHVGLADRLPAADRGTVESESILEAVLVQHADRVRHVLPDPGKVGKAQIQNLAVVLLGVRNHFIGSSSCSHKLLLITL